MNPQTEQNLLEHRATLARQRLLAVVDELDKKRHALSHPVKLLKKQLPDTAYLVAGGIAALTGVAAIATLVVRARAKRRRELRARFRIERGPPQPSFPADVGARVAKALLTFGLVQLGKALINARLRKKSELAR